MIMNDTTKVYNFSAGPAMIPREVLCQVKRELYNWKNLKKSIMEISHRSQEFISVVQEIKHNLRKLLHIPNSYKIVFCHGGARGQFSAIPMNFSKNANHSSHNNVVDYINSGYWSYSAALEAKKYCYTNILNVCKTNNKKQYILPMNTWEINDNSLYLHYCPNETIDGIAIHEEPKFNDKKIVIGDFSSTILSKRINLERYSFIYASSQKNIGPSGITLIIMHESLLQNINSYVPSILNYKILVNSNSMFNTPNTFSLYLSGLILKWIKKIGGIKEIEKRNIIKSNMLYNMIDSTDFYINDVVSNNRSRMNVPFTIINTKLHEIFVKEAYKYGLHALKGHNLKGGIRASIYNAMPIKGVLKLINFMKIFEKKYG
ncbi:phosphoserine aminotransferase [Buchnera aphidicola str. Bp (Baizongia pistaciae)]|uniref:Phosphoserine aminotransferase n=1 Tax=Buchnera aphidicola subsp. Baizongia pistaciae (strain Bp) TaxID=224915 RepID=SERC_BUCBP|nr:3-phosphoserine/phosphohydroxythreonine transaminase [Buchnera aphidicola]P59492.1 RecName: Full=Phosphoserine aminotransferase; AltName: Full=Phosphohydroxythreonine aminotransferase; Short=PSAT [Buchnera aphidicola str. Bp (Baizongia pistaciae)]AAO27014.1 phosphoserine aminotransferase [Buchnera aphidicola str. Bp (Baizongia pistaciae)]